MRVLIITQYFWPENFKINDLVIDLKKRKYEVEVLTGRPNYPSGDIYDEYKQSPNRYSVYEGIPVHRVKNIPRGNSKIQLALNYFSFVFLSSIKAFNLRNKFDIIFVYEPSPITVCLPAIFLKWISSRETKIIFWVLDIWPDTVWDLGIFKNNIGYKAVYYLCQFIYGKCDIVLGHTNEFTKLIKSRSPKTNVYYFPSWSELEGFKDFSTPNYLIENFQQGDNIKLLFAGNIGEAQDFSSIVKAFSIIKKEKLQCTLDVAGAGRFLGKAKNLVEENDLKDRINFLGSFEVNQMPDLLANYHACVITLQNKKIFNITVPGRIQTFLLHEKIILSMLSGETNRIISEADCGFVADSGDYLKFVENVRKLLLLGKDEIENLSKNSLKYYNKHFLKKSLIDKLEEYIKR